MEEAKASEAQKFQNALEALQKKLDEANATFLKEKEEAARKALEEAPPVIKEKEVHVEDTKKVESMQAEINELKVMYLYLYLYLYLILFFWSFF